MSVAFAVNNVVFCALKIHFLGSSLRSLSPQPPEEEGNHRSWWKFGASKRDKDAIEVGKEIEESKLESVEKIVESIPPEKSMFLLNDLGRCMQKF